MEANPTPQPKPIRLSAHAQEQMALRGATEDEIKETIRRGEWQPAKRGRQHAVCQFGFDKPSPVNQQTYRFKTVDAVFVDEPREIVVVTVKVFYSDKEQSQ